MTNSIEIVDRMRWVSAAAASALLALTVAVVLAVVHQPLTTPPGTPAAAAFDSRTDTLDPRIAALAASHPGRSLEAIVQFNAGVSNKQAQSDAVRVGARITGTLHIIPALGVRLTAAQARSLAASPDVRAVSLNAQITPQSGSLDGRSPGPQLDSTYDETLGVLPLWRAGLTGVGVGVAVVDTGVDGALRDFRASSGNSRVVETAVTNPAARTVQDAYGHGTDVAGIIAGRSRDYSGVAPGANLISIKVSDDAGRATVLDVIYGLQFAVDRKRDFNIRVVNLSLDSATPQSYKNDPLDAAVESAWFHGLVVVTAAGNRGDAPDAVHYAPANDPYAITVGAVDENGTPDPADDAIASWSARGTTQDGFEKPDVYAPGAHIVSVLAPGSVFAGSCTDCIVDHRYIRTSGTSMAAPMISGLIADVLQAHPSLTPNQIKGALTSAFVRAQPAIQEVNAVRVALDVHPSGADAGLTANSLLGAEGNIDYSRSSWSLSSWSVAKGALKAGFALSSWSCASCTGGKDAADPSLSSWSLSSWSTVQPLG